MERENGVSYALFFISVLGVYTLQCQAVGVFPSVRLLSVGKPVLTNSTCRQQAFCSHESPVWPSSACSAQQCNDTCPGATGLPSAAQLSQLPRTSVAASQSVANVIIFNNGYLRYGAAHAPALDGGSGFSFAVNYLPISDVEVTLFSKVQSGTTVFAVSILLTQISRSSRVRVVYTPADSITRTRTLQTLPYQRTGRYLHVVVSYLHPQVNVYANGTMLAAGVLDAPLHDSGGDLFIGALSDGASLPRFDGLMSANIYIYHAAISERSSGQLYTGGALRAVVPQSDCRCSPLFPRVSPTDASQCLHPILTAQGSAGRLNPQSYPSVNVNDGNLSSVWVSQSGQTHVSLVLDLQGIFEIQSVVVWFLNPHARSAVIEVSSDGSSYHAIQYFSDDCQTDFGVSSDTERTRIEQISCKTTHETNARSQQGLAFFADRHNSSTPITMANPFSTSISPTTTSRFVRIRLLAFNSSLSNIQDQYYAISEVEISGRCSCNGHTDFCSVNTATAINRCECQYNTEGDMCEKCQDLYNSKPWLAGNSTSPNACLPCQCNGHATSCAYNASLDTNPASRSTGSGSQCSCRDNTTGGMCNECARYYYRDVSKPLNNIAVCLHCQCSRSGVSDDGDCIKSGTQLGQCHCKPHIGGRQCDECATHAYLNATFGVCVPCGCSASGAHNDSCDATGRCPCRPGFKATLCDRCTTGLAGPLCDTCAPGYWSYNSTSASCRPCSCATLTGALDNVCDGSTGQCSCRLGFDSSDCSRCKDVAGTMGPTCGSCRTGFYGFNGSFCHACSCNGAGSLSADCDRSTGNCSCLAAFTGRDCRQCRSVHGTAGANCTTCRDGFHSYNGSHCEACQCSVAGSLLVGCGSDGSCKCKQNVVGLKCTQCTASSLALDSSNPHGCGNVSAVTFTDISQTSYRVHWMSPSPTGIASYSLFEDLGSRQPASRVHYTTVGTSGSHVVTALVPLTTKRYFVRACTIDRCVNSASSTVTTLSSAPMHQADPYVGLRNVSTFIQWPGAVLSGRGNVAYQLHVVETSSAATPQSRSYGAQFTGNGFAKLNSIVPDVTDFKVSIQFRTFASNCLLYLARNASSNTLLAVYINSDQPYIVINSGSATTTVDSGARANVSDGSLHSLTATVRGGRLEIEVDGVVGTTAITSPRSSTSPLRNVYIGGTPASLFTQLPLISGLVIAPFHGCFVQMSIHGVRVNLTTAITESLNVNSATFGCPADQRRGVHFLGAPNGFARTVTNPLVSAGVVFQVSLSFRTDRDTGLLLYSESQSKSDVVALFLRNGTLVSAVDTGSGIASAEVTTSASFCDGQWHSVSFSKSVTSITLAADGLHSTSTLLSSPDMSCDVDGGLYFGGVPSSMVITEVTVESNGFSGCMQTPLVNSQRLSFERSDYVHMDGCSGSTTCLSSHIDGSNLYPRLLYSGKSREVVLPAGTLPPSADLVFKVTAATNSGMAASNWTILHVSDTLPSGLAAPSVQFRPATSAALVTFSPPSQANGLIVGYRILLTASPTFQLDYYTYLGKPLQTQTFVEVNNDVFSHIVTSLLPAHKYQVRIEASTPVGSAASKAVTFTTPEAAPTGLLAPVITGIGSRGSSISWTLPAQPNGNLSQLTVSINNSVVLNASNALLFAVNASGLEPYSTYDVSVQYCTAVGCTSSDSSTFNTLPAPPTGIAAPTITVLGDTSVQVTWTPVQQENGILSGYEVLSGPARPYRVHENASPDARRVVVDGLLPATLYQIRIRATNQVGSVTSGSTQATTLEGAPAGIAVPVVTNIMSNSLVLSWTVPTTPNGVIVRYHVLRDGQVVHNSSADKPLTASDSHLAPYTNYSYAIMACTARLCAVGAETTVSTAEAVPVGLQPPSLSAISSTAIQVAWTTPAQRNGRLTYALFVHGPTSYGSGHGALISTTVIGNLAESTTRHIVANLLPFQLYSVILNAETSAGGVNTTRSLPVRTFEAAPSGVSNLTVSVTSSTSLSVSWRDPLRVNGIVLQFMLLVEDVALGRIVPSLQFNSSIYRTSVANLLPYTMYSIQLQVTTGGGSSTGEKVVVRTLQDVPSGVNPPLSTNITSRRFDVYWLEPSSPNGIILRYELVLDGPQGVRRFPVGPSARSYQIATSNGISLMPFTTYSLWLSACTVIGCGRSSAIAVPTLHDYPSGFDQPILLNAAATSLNFSWKAPRQPNGIIQSYTLRLLSADSSAKLSASVIVNISTMPLALLEAVFVNLRPSTTYDVQLEVTNTIGRSLAPSLVANTTDGTPANITPPAVLSLSMSAIRLSWKAPGQPNGQITSYTLYRNGSRVHMATRPGHFNDTSLHVFTTYVYTLMVCTRYACTNSSAGTGRTAQGLASGISPPSILFSGKKTANITWTPPTTPNGIVTTYSIWRQLAANCCPVTGSSANCTLSQSCLGSEAVVYTGNASILQAEITDLVLLAYTQYAYRVIVTTGAGDASGRYSLAVAPQDAPSGLRQPRITATGAAFITLSWTEPDLPNGIIASYHFLRNSSSPTTLPSSARVYNDTANLQPHVVYSYVLSACTTIGLCTTAQPRLVLTNQSIPAGLAAPAAQAISSSDISLLWQVPAQPNGLITKFQLRQIASLRAPLVLGPNVLNATVTGLAPFTVYSFVLDACTVVGCVASSASSPVHTLESAPTLLGPPTVSTLSSTAVNVSWVPPLQPNGILTGYRIYRNGSTVADLSANRTSYVDAGLAPYTVYGYEVESMNSAGSAQSFVAAALTRQDKPAFVQPPQISFRNSSAFTFSFPLPSQPNGILTNFSLLIDGMFHRSSGLIHRATVLGLEPFSNYSFQLEVCTVVGCTVSSAIIGQTSEALAEVNLPPNVTAISPTAVVIRWSAPDEPNGIIQNYQVERRPAVGPGLSTVIGKTGPSLRTLLDDALLPFTEYEYRLQVINAAGSSPSPWNLVRTHEALPLGVLLQTVRPLQRSVILMWNPPSNPRGIITRYEVQARRASSSAPFNIAAFTNGSLGVEVYGLNPYTAYVFRLVAINTAGAGGSPTVNATTLQDIPEKLEKIVVTGQDTAAGSWLNLSWLPPAMANGIITEYQVLDAAGTVEYIGAGLGFLFRRLTPYTVYSLHLRACTAVGCSDGALQRFVTPETQPALQLPPSVTVVSSRSVNVTWTPPGHANGILTLYTIVRQLSNSTAPALVATLDPRQNVSLVIVDSGLQPFTSYKYAVRSGNRVGSALSAFSLPVRTLPAPPEGLGSAATVTQSSSQILVTWTTPTSPNGIISSIEVLRNSTPIVQLPVSTLSYLDSQLRPARGYCYAIRTCVHSAGCANSTAACNRTAEEIPLGVSPPMLNAVNSSSVRAVWTAPLKPRGAVTAYNVYITQPCAAGPRSCRVFSGLEFSTAITHLLPFTLYTVQLEACTAVGCSHASAQVTTLQAAPSKPPAPVATALSSNTVNITFSAPSPPNGVIQRYSVIRNKTFVSLLDAYTLSYLVIGLQQSTLYGFAVEAQTAGGTSLSDTTLVRTFPEAPTNVSAINATAISSSVVVLEWEEAGEPYAQPVYYLVTNFVTGEVLNTTSLTAQLGSLTPYTLYSVGLSTCTRYGCTESVPVDVVTLEAPPSSLSALIVTSATGRSIAIRWSVPTQSNGILTGYDVEKRLTGNTTITTAATYQPPFPALSYTDTSVYPVTEYEYRVVALNSAGLAASAWTRARTLESFPDGVVTPDVRQVTKSSLSTVLHLPARPNGVITAFRLYVNSSAGAVRKENQNVLVTGLLPFTVYSLVSSFCTRAGCGNSTSIAVRTGEDVPREIMPPVITGITARSMRVNWESPTEPNGEIVRFLLFITNVCRAKAGLPQLPCAAQRQMIYRGTARHFDVHNLTPFTQYFYDVQAENSVGSVSSNESTVHATLIAAPEVTGQLTYSISNMSAVETIDIVIEWSQAFRFNGNQFVRYVLLENRATAMVIASAVQTSATLERREYGLNYSFAVQLAMSSFSEVQTSAIYVLQERVVTTPAVVTEAAEVSKPIHETAGFIVGMVLLGLVLIVVLIFCIHRPSRKDAVGIASDGTHYDNLQSYSPNEPNSRPTSPARYNNRRGKAKSDSFDDAWDLERSNLSMEREPGKARLVNANVNLYRGDTEDVEGWDVPRPESRRSRGTEDDDGVGYEGPLLKDTAI